MSDYWGGEPELAGCEIPVPLPGQADGSHDAHGFGTWYPSHPLPYAQQADLLAAASDTVLSDPLVPADTQTLLHTPSYSSPHPSPHVSPRPSPHPATHARRRTRRPREGPRLGLGWFPILICTAVAAGTSTLSALIAYAPLKHAASPTGSESSAWWPLLLYGPWIAAVASVVRRRIQSRALRRVAWAILLGTSAIAVMLCITQAPHTLTGVVTAGLPPVAALICVRLLVHSVRPPAVSRHAAGRRDGERRKEEFTFL
ncbi:hypothetical protein ACIQNU_38705 [Streptomyces sp. NPDC091292]|uniref:hypothetical protein n=1 Tax=Streptomyces sp. NPDC091292 TaxID=3365991 RepID=UPI00381BE449